jgi:hypothetical protein
MRIGDHASHVRKQKLQVPVPTAPKLCNLKTAWPFFKCGSLAGFDCMPLLE